VYYCPVMSLHQQASLPCLYAFFPLLRCILLRERIDLVHGHQSTSALSHECLLHARSMGLPTVFTDHSLFSFASAPAIHLNKWMAFTLRDVQQVICVSHTSKENLTLRARIKPHTVNVIPNAVDTTKLTPKEGNAPNMSERKWNGADAPTEEKR
jgi:phosphatidylinositol glycan class A protein